MVLQSMLLIQQDESKSGLQTRLQRERVMDNIVQVNKDLYLNIAEAVKIEPHGKSYRISIRNSTGTLTEYYCHPEAPGYNKLKELLTKTK